MKLEVKPLTPARWADLEALFGANGACGGCWCMYWRVEPGTTWEDLKGARAKRRFKALVERGEAQGLLAYADGEPVGWLAHGPRRDFAKLDRAPSLACDDADEVHSVPCFFVKAGFRQRGVAAALLEAAVRAAKQSGARTLEGYPVKASTPGKPIPPAFAWTGTVPLFERAGFGPASPTRRAGKQRMRLALRRS